MADFIDRHKISISVVLFVIVISIIFWVTPLGQNPRFTQYVTVISVVGALLAIGAFVRQEANAVEENKLRVINAGIVQTQAGWIDLEKMLLNEPALLRIYQQMYPHNLPLQQIPLPREFEDSPITNKEIHFTSIIFQLIENIVAPIGAGLETFESNDNETWLITFRSWFKSSILRNQWYYNKHFYTKTTQLIVDTVILQGHLSNKLSQSLNQQSSQLNISNQSSNLDSTLLDPSEINISNQSLSIDSTQLIY